MITKEEETDLVRGNLLTSLLFFGLKDRLRKRRNASERTYVGLLLGKDLGHVPNRHQDAKKVVSLQDGGFDGRIGALGDLFGPKDYLEDDVGSSGRKVDEVLGLGNTVEGIRVRNDGVLE